MDPETKRLIAQAAADRAARKKVVASTQEQLDQATEACIEWIRWCDEHAAQGKAPAAADAEAPEDETA